MKKSIKKSIAFLIAITVSLGSYLQDGVFYNSFFDQETVNALVHRERLFDQYTWPTSQLKDSGCGIFALGNALYCLNGKSLDVESVGKWAKSNGSWNPGKGGMTRSLFYENKSVEKQFGQEYGFTIKDCKYGNIKDADLINHLKSGGVAILHVDNHFICAVDYSDSNEYYVIESYTPSTRGLSEAGWVSASKLSSGRTNVDWFCLISATTPSPPPAVLQPDSRFSPFLSFIAYPSVTGNTDTYNSDCSSSKGGKVYSSDKCSITAVYTNGWCNVTYPGINDIPKDGFVPLSTFILDLSSNFAEVTAPKQITTFAKPGLTENIGYIDNGDKCYKLGVSGNSVQVLYPTVSGYKLGWTAAGDWVKPVPQTTDTRFNPYCPIKTYILSPNENKPVYNDSHNAQEGTVFYSDFSTIEEVYSDGWCKITYPAGNTTKTKQIQLSEIVYDINSQHVSYTATDKINVYTKYDMSSSPNWWISAGDKFFVVGKKDGNLQVMYPLDAGGYKLGWIPAGDLPVTTYKISYNANGGSGAPAEQTKKYNEPVTISSTVPKREGYIFGGWGTSDKATSPSYVSGGNYTANSSIELYAIWNPVIYNISYDLNGGTGSIPLQSKTHGITSSLSKVVPEKKYTVIYVSELSENGLEKSVLSSCKFLGWSTSQTSAKAEYSAGGTFDLNKDTVLYAVWEPAQIGTLMDAPVKAGYSFDGWYTDNINGKKVDSALAINEDVFLYAHWTPNKYSIALNSNGGTVSVTSIQREYNSEYGSIEIPERDGYTFTGWYSDEYCKNAVTSDTVVSTAADHKLYAGWTVNSYKVSFDAAGGECSELSTFANYNTTCELPVPVREGYTFAGWYWYKDKDYSEEFTGTTKVTADITVYAKWNAEAVSGTEIKGDVDKDGEITLKDIRILRQYYKDKTSIDIDMKVADLDEDGDVTLKDIRILRVIYRDL